MGRSITTAIISAVLVSACVVLPVNRTYYEPNPADGKLVRSTSCGWHRTANDTLERYIDGTNTTISVLPRYEEEKPLLVHLLIRGSSGVELNAERVELRVGSSKSAVQPRKVEVSDARPYFYKSIELTFPPSVSAEEEIAVVLLPGFLTVDGIRMVTTPFRFRKVTKGDVYYGSINC